MPGSSSRQTGRAAPVQVKIQLAEPNVRCNVSVAAGALTAEAGQPTAASNTLSLLWDQQGPQVSSGLSSMVLAGCIQL